MDLTGKTVLVVGSGISGVAATELLKKKNVNVVLFDGNKGWILRRFVRSTRSLRM